MTVDDLRELVARALQQANNAFYDQPDGTLMMHGPEGYYRACADAVIQALTEAGRLLPAIPDWVEEVNLAIAGEGKRTDPTHKGIWNRVEFGTGPTIPLALADALAANGGE